MKIVCDTNLPLGRTLFSTLGQVTLADGSRLTPELVRDADMLMVRDVPLNKALLEGSSVRFIGTAVTGTDHVDADWLAEAGIRWVHAPRANGESVADYCIAALLEYAHTRHHRLDGATVALIGVGWIGGMIRRRCEALGMRVLCCDPPRKDNPRDVEAQNFLPQDVVLAQADYIIPFVPLTKEWPHPTWHMLNAETLKGAKYGAVLINMARGAVCDTKALIAALRDGQLSDAIIDVWEGEPDFSPELADLAFLATPHLAGHSYEGKVNGTIAVRGGALVHHAEALDGRGRPSELPGHRPLAGGAAAAAVCHPAPHLSLSSAVLRHHALSPACLAHPLGEGRGHRVPSARWQCRHAPEHRTELSVWLRYFWTLRAYGCRRA